MEKKFQKLTDAEKRKKHPTGHKYLFYRLTEDSYGNRDKTWLARVRDGKKEYEKALGKASIMSLDEAHLQAQLFYAKAINNELEQKKSRLEISIIGENYFRLRANEDKSTQYTLFTTLIKPYFRHFDFQNVKRKDIDSFKQHLEIRKKKNGEKYAPATLKLVLATLKTMLSEAYRYDYMEYDSSKYISLKRIKNERIRFLSEDEIGKLFQDDRVINNPTYFLLFKLALNTGARFLSLYRLTIQDLDFENNLIFFHQIKKSDAYYSYFNDELKELLHNRITLMKLKPEDRIFAQNESSFAQYARHLLRLIFNRHIKNQEMKVTFHTLRHTFASHHAIGGTPLNVIQKLLNHSEISMTLRYAHLNQKTLKKFQEKIIF